MSDSATPDASDPAGSPDAPGDGRPMSTDEIRDTYADRASWFARLDWLDRLVTGRYREPLFSQASGRVLDVACGTGVNFPYLPPDVDLVGIDVSPEMLAGARQQLDGLDLDGELHEMDAQALAFEADSFDTVISSLSTCTFPDPVAALREMDRVCKPSGQILLLEHGRSDVEPIGRLQDWRADAHYESMGCRLTQEPLDHVAAAGLDVRDVRTALFGIVTAVEAEPSGD
ncbi:class I SAM-dependent methyltransferase [Natronoarchaeum mannanilyticum]|uniref:Methyltransferase type 11 domain-containing protein n=1 Tax=Natronoarchaeum mannanilyticum TaxID=926360 RepID=A0AAV3T9Y3_9EURY